MALNNSDLILCVGCRLDDRVTGQVENFAPRAKLIHIDVDASEIGKILPSAVPIVGDAKPVLKALLKKSAAWPNRPENQIWLKQIDEWKQKHPMGYRQKDGVIMPQQAIETLGGLLDEEAIIATGVGQHQMFTAQYYPFKRPRSFITSGGLGTMGFGWPASLGAKLGCPDRTVVCVDGDGSFLMNIQELSTAVRYRIGVVAMILNNSYLGMVRQWQELFYDNRLSETSLQCPAYDQVAKAFGGLGRSVQRPEELEPALKWALSQSKEQSLPVVLDVKVAPEANVLPMVAPGGANVDFVPCKV